MKDFIFWQMNPYKGTLFRNELIIANLKRYDVSENKCRSNGPLNEVKTSFFESAYLKNSYYNFSICYNACYHNSIDLIVMNSDFLRILDTFCFLPDKSMGPWFSHYPFLLANDNYYFQFYNMKTGGL